MSRNTYDLRSSSLAAFADVVTMQISIVTQEEPPKAPAPPPLPRNEFVKKYVAYMEKQKKRSTSNKRV